MTDSPSFTERAREHVAATAESWSTARAALDAEPAPATATWAAAPEHSDEAIRKATGAGWDEWVARIDAGPGRAATHTEIAAWVNANSDIGGWWSQGVTVGYERITGMRLPGQRPDGTFTLSRTRTFAVAPDHLRALLEDEGSLTALLPAAQVTRTSKAGVKAPRYALEDAADAAGTSLGTLQLGFDPAPKGAKLTVTHEKLPSFGATEPWKDFWAAWLDAVGAALTDS
ncbi:hypothetical protein [uncultured Demequina sp.]|uniref:hypothetical protein n=1 Tax=uncultured Demequina sp. TaxID=693499 RepID=UPI0025FFF47E|nr:hypothetical protein [uncultured Demequina sp.]